MGLLTCSGIFTGVGGSFRSGEATYARFVRSVRSFGRPFRKGRPFRFGVHLHPSYVGASVSAFTSLPPPAPLLATSARVVRFVSAFTSPPLLRRDIGERLHSLPPPAPSANAALTTSLHSLLSLRPPPPHYSSLRPPPFVGLLAYSGIFTPATMEAVAVGRVCVSRGTLHL